MPTSCLLKYLHNLLILRQAAFISELSVSCRSVRTNENPGKQKQVANKHKNKQIKEWNGLSTNPSYIDDCLMVVRERVNLREKNPYLQ